MAAATAELNTHRKEGVYRDYPIAASTTLYVGAMVAIDADGYAVNSADTANLRYVGLAQNNGLSYDNSAGADGDLMVRVDADFDFKVAFDGTATQANVGDLVYAVDNQTVDLVGVTTNDILVGRIVAIHNAGWVWINQQVSTDSDA